MVLRLLMEKQLKRIVNDNRGTSLMELIVAILVVSVVAVALTGLVAVSVNQYRVRGAEAKLQVEGQAILSRLEKIIKSADKVTAIPYQHNEKYYKAIVVEGKEAKEEIASESEKKNGEEKSITYMQAITVYYVFLIENAYSSEGLEDSSRDMSDQQGMVRYKRMEGDDAQFRTYRNPAEMSESMNVKDTFQSLIDGENLFGSEKDFFAAYVDDIVFSDLNPQKGYAEKLYNIKMKMKLGGTELTMEQDIIRRNR